MSNMTQTPRYDNCTCVFSCADDPATACSLSGDWHVHPQDRTGVFGPCPVHPEAPGDGPGPPTLGPMPIDPQTTRELALAAAKVRAWTEKRNKLIREAFEAGAGVREIAKATGLNVGTVHTMLHGRKR